MDGVRGEACSLFAAHDSSLAGLDVGMGFWLTPYAASLTLRPDGWTGASMGPDTEARTTKSPSRTQVIINPLWVRELSSFWRGTTTGDRECSGQWQQRRQQAVPVASHQGRLGRLGMIALCVQRRGSSQTLASLNLELATRVSVGPQF
jgi:hypothetical protein